MSHELILSRELAFHSFDIDSGPDYLDFDFHWVDDTEKARRVCLRFKSNVAKFAIGTRAWDNGQGGGWDFYEFLVGQHLPRLLDLLPPEELARLTAARMRLPDG